MTTTPNTGPRFTTNDRPARVFDLTSGAEIVSYPNLPMGVCLGELCPDQTASIGETEGVAAILATVEKCEACVGCVLRNAEVTTVEVQNA